MQWVQFRLDTSASLAPRCEDVLLDLGAAAVTLQDNADQPLFDRDGPGHGDTLWRETRVTGLFPADTDTEALWQAFPDPLREGCSHRTEILEDKDWEREWMRDYSAIQCAPGLWICPSWLEPPEPEAVNLMLDPGLAFGTGTHPTTAMCMALLADMALDGRHVLDYGCGSGVLAIAALLLGADSAVGVDIDPLALVSSRSNAQRNAIADERLHLALPADTPAGPPADIVIANILAGPLGQLAPALAQHLADTGTLVLSGILQEQAAGVIAAYADVGINLKPAASRDGWVALAGGAP